MAAALRHKVKLGTHKRELEEAKDQGLPFMQGPLVFEGTGAMGEEAQKWWKSIVEMETDQRTPGAPQSRGEQGLEHTWSANKFSSYWLQTISMSHARMQSESIAQWIGLANAPNESHSHILPCAPRAHQLVDFIEHAADITKQDRRGYMMSTALRID